jgi:hypothetical protein
VADELERVALVMPVRLPSDAGAHYPTPEKVEPDPTWNGKYAAEAAARAEVDEPEPDDEPEAESVDDETELERVALEYVAEVAAELEADENDGAGHVIDLPPAPVMNGNGNGHGSTVDRSALVAKLREGTSTGSEDWCPLADVGEAGGVRVRLVGGPDGRPRIDARRFVSSKRYNGPTKKGFAVEPGAAAVLAGLLLDAAAAAAELETV